MLYLMKNFVILSTDIFSLCLNACVRKCCKCWNRLCLCNNGRDTHTFSGSCTRYCTNSFLNTNNMKTRVSSGLSPGQRKRMKETSTIEKTRERVYVPVQCERVCFYIKFLFISLYKKPKLASSADVHWLLYQKSPKNSKSLRKNCAEKKYIIIRQCVCVCACVLPELPFFIFCCWLPFMQMLYTQFFYFPFYSLSFNSRSGGAPRHVYSLNKF